MDSDLTRVAGDTLARIARHRAAADPVAQTLLKEIQERLLDTSFKAADLELPDPVYSTLRAFREATGQSPQDYVLLSRLVIAARLLTETELPHHVIAEMVGLADNKELRSYCRTWLDLNPSELRKNARAARQAGRQPFPTLTGYRRWLAGELGSKEVGEMAARREQIESDFGRTTVAGRPLFELASAGPGFTLHVRMLLGYSRDQRLRLLRNGVFRGSIDAFEGFSRHSRQEGRKDRRRGVELAEMALAIVEGSPEELGKRTADCLALGWARLGNARRLASDLKGAEKAIRQAEEWVGRAGNEDRVYAEVQLLKGSLRLFQRRFSEAIECYTEAVASSQVADAKGLLTDALFQRANAHLYQGRPLEAMPDLDKAHHLLPRTDKWRQLGSAQCQLHAAILAGDRDRARALLPELQELSRETQDRPSSFQIRWLEGWLLCAEGDLEAAERPLREARAGFISLQDFGTSAIVSLDLALLYHQQGGHAVEVRSLASDALPALRSLELPEAATAATLLQKVIRERAVHRSVLELARRRLLAPGSR